MGLILERNFVARSLTAVGLEHDLPPIHRQLDGSIDYEWYIRRSRVERSRAVGRALSRLAVKVVDLVRRNVVQPFRARLERQRAIAELMSLDDHMLHDDLGISRSGVYYAVDHGRDGTPIAANENERGGQKAA